MLPFNLPVEDMTHWQYLILIYDLFSDQKKKISKTSRSDPVKATRQAFDAIINMTNVSHKYQLLLQALEAAGL